MSNTHGVRVFVCMSGIQDKHPGQIMEIMRIRYSQEITDTYPHDVEEACELDFGSGAIEKYVCFSGNCGKTFNLII